MNKKLCVLLLVPCILTCSACSELNGDNQILDEESGQKELETDYEKEEDQSEWEWKNDIDYLEKKHPKYFQDITKIDALWEDAKDQGVFVNNYSWSYNTSAKIIIGSTDGTYSTREKNYIDHLTIWLEHFSLDDEQHTIDAALNWARNYIDMDILNNKYTFETSNYFKPDGVDSEYYQILYNANNDKIAEKYGRVFCVQITTDHDGYVTGICLEHSVLNSLTENEDKCFEWDGLL